MKKWTDKALGKVVLSHGSHSSYDDGHCAMEWGAKTMGEAITDNPVFMRGKPELRTFVISLNDRMPDELRNSIAFKRAVVACFVAEAGPEVQRKRAFRCADWSVRETAPFALEAASKAMESAGLQTHADNLRDHAAKLRAVTPITDQQTADAAARYADAAARYADAAARYAAAAAAATADEAARYAAAAARYAAAAARYAAAAAATADEAADARNAQWKRSIAFLAELAAMKATNEKPKRARKSKTSKEASDV